MVRIIKSSLNLIGKRAIIPQTLLGVNTKTVGAKGICAVAIDIDYLKFKMSIINNFLEPLVNADLDTVLKNQYNFDYITSRLVLFENSTNRDEITLMKKVVNLMKQAASIRVSYSNMYERIYGTKAVSMNRLIFETSRIILKAPFEIYDNLFGVKEGQEYNKTIIYAIENILEENPGIMFNDIKEKIDLLNFVLDE
jgi:hypothetical protein